MALWQVRATVVDKPGFLAVLAASLALRSVNILSVGVHITEAGAVDDFLVDAPDELTGAEVLAAVERGRGRNAWVAPAEARSLVDAPTRALDLATHLVRDPAAVAAALAELLSATAGWSPEPEQLGVAGSRMWVPAPGGGAWLVERNEPEFTPAEYARAQALLALAAAARRPAAGVAETAGLLLPDGTELAVRLAGPGDLAAVQAMHRRCSPASRHRRYLSGAGEPSAAQLARLLAPARGASLLAELPDAGELDRVVAMANLLGEGVQVEFAALVEDRWQRRGIGTALLRRAIGIAAAAGFAALVVHFRAPQVPGVLGRLGLASSIDTDAGMQTVTLQLGRTSPAAGPGSVDATRAAVG